MWEVITTASRTREAKELSANTHDDDDAQPPEKTRRRGCLAPRLCAADYGARRRGARASRRGHSQRARRRERAAGEHLLPSTKSGAPRPSRARLTGGISRQGRQRCFSLRRSPRAARARARARRFGYLLFPGALTAGAAVRSAACDNTTTIFRAWRPGWCRKNGARPPQHQNGSCPRTRTSAAEAAYGHISTWETSDGHC